MSRLVPKTAVEKATLQLCDSCDFFACPLIKWCGVYSNQWIIQDCFGMCTALVKSPFSPQTHLGTCVNLFSVFMWRNRIPKLKTTFPSEVIVALDKISYRKRTFDNVLVCRGSSFCYRARLNFQAFSLRDLKWRQEKTVANVKRWAIALLFAI